MCFVGIAVAVPGPKIEEVITLRIRAILPTARVSISSTSQSGFPWLWSYQKTICPNVPPIAQFPSFFRIVLPKLVVLVSGLDHDVLKHTHRQVDGNQTVIVPPKWLRCQQIDVDQEQLLPQHASIVKH